MGAEESLVGKVGRVTVSIPAQGPGEVLLPVRGGSEAFAAWSDEPIARHRRIVVVETLSAEATAFSTRAIAEAQAEANKARAASLREGNQELIAANRLVEILPALVEAAARGLTDSNLTILNGTQGVNEVVAGLVGQGLSILDTLRKSAAVAGHAPAPVSAAPGGYDRADAT